ncbi:MAG: S8/S53 family peptidase [Chitinophagaceae bacterium]
MKSKNKGALWLLLLALIGGGGFLVWKYLLKKNGSSNYVSSIEMKLPDAGTIQMTKEFGLIPVTQFGIVMKKGFTKKDAEKIAADAGGIITGAIDIINFYQLEIKSSTAVTFNQNLLQLQQKPGVELVSPNGLLVLNESAGTCDPLDDPMYKDTSQGRIYQMIGLKNANAYIKASGLKLNPVKVGVMDTRVYKGSDELGGNNSIKNFTTDTKDYNNDPDKDKLGNIINGGITHGTMTTQIIGANADNGGVTGVASMLGNNLTIETCNVFTPNRNILDLSTPDPDDPSKTTDNDGVSYVHNDIKAIFDQIKNGATVINCSYGPLDYNNQNRFESDLYLFFYSEIKRMYPKVVIVVSAGNNNKPLNGMNGSTQGHKVGNILTVGAMDPDGKKSDYSNYGTSDGELTMSAPADDMIHGMDKNGNPIRTSGTSFAAPQVAGAVALMQSINPDLNAEEIKKILVNTAQKEITGRHGEISKWEYYGAGMLRVDLAVLKVINDMRVKQGLSVLLPASMLDMNTISLSYKGGPENYTITAEIKAINGKSTNLSIEVTGNNYSIGGNRQQSLSAPGQVSWTLSTTKPDDKLTVRVSRSDTRACAWVVIESIELSGVWDLQASLISADLFQVPAGVAEKSIGGLQFPFGSLDVDAWKKAGWPITKEGNTFVFTLPGTDNVTYYIEKITGDTFIGKATGKSNNSGHIDIAYYGITGTKKH